MPYTLYINAPEKIIEFPLPAVNNKKINLDISEGYSGCSLELQVLDGKWKITSAGDLRMYIDDRIISETEISDGDVIHLLAESGELFAVMVKETVSDSFKKYSLTGKNTFSIGRAEDNDIVLNNEFVGSHHCVISVSDGYDITDNSKNGTFVNGKRIAGTAVLNIFDTIYISGCKLIFMGKFIAVCSSENVAVKLSEADIQKLENTHIYEDNSFFSRAPRRIEPLDDETVEIDDPPAKQKMRSQPLIFIIGPSVTMPIPILVSVLVNIVSNSSSVKSGSMYLGTAVSVVLSALIGTCWALAHQYYNKKQITEDEKERVEAYDDYISNNRRLLEEKHIKNKSILEKSYLSTEDFIALIDTHPEIFWNRNIYQSDFLTIRLGRGKVKLPADITVSKQRFSMNKDELCRYPHELHDKYEMMDNCVSLLSIISHKIIGMIGDLNKLPLIVNNIICQSAALHCYTDIKIGFLGEISDKAKYSWIKWLPHTFIGGKKRIISFDDISEENVIYEIAAELRRRTEASEESNGETTHLPHMLIFCTSADILRNSILGKYISSPAYLGVTFVLIYGGINSLPNECKAIIECSEDFSGFYLLDRKINDENKISFELIDSQSAEKFARGMSGYYVTESSREGIPFTVNYFDMLGIGKPEHWDLATNYKISRSYEGLKSFIGIGQGGKPVYLDIHDKKDGPHGLVAGTTGSGKSETLQTFILSLVMNYSPEDVAFVLIDYKGGGMANVFKGLPHISGMITNLSDEVGGEFDRSLTRRAYSSLRSEIKRRQTIFGKYKINHIDSYARLYSEGKVDEAMPHLIIISDEFAELKKEQPEFIKELISVARVGRSLGIHLILATQKPSGVVDDEIWSNSRFRICLRVQDKQDSAGMLKRPDAAYITEAGRAFLQIGNDEIFEEFQSAYSGGDYVPKEAVVSAEDSEAVMIEIDGSLSVVHNLRKTGVSNETELDAAVKYISEQTEKHGFKEALFLWLPPLERNIFLDDVDDAYDNEAITVTYGMIDNYEQQRQYPGVIRLADCSNLKICGISGSGKTTLLKSILCSAVKKYTPEEISFYIMDFSSRTFKMFNKLPHCGGVVYEGETEAASRLIKLMFDIIEQRKVLFEQEDIGSYNEYTKLHKLPLIVLAIDNMSAFTEFYSDYEEAIVKLLHDGVRYGIQVVITVNNSSEIKYKMRSYVLNSIALRMNEKSEYTELIESNPEYVPASVPGRGLVASEGFILEYQTVLPAKGKNEAERSESMKKLFAELSDKYSDMKKAKKIPVLSDSTSYHDLLSDFDSSSLLLGYDFESIEPYGIPFSSFFCYTVSAHDDDGIALVLNNVLKYAENKCAEIKAISVNTDIHLNLPQTAEAYNMRSIVEYLHSEFTARNKAVAEWNNDNKGMTRDSFMAEKFGRVFVIIDDMVKFCEMIYERADNKEYADLMEMFFKNGKNHGIHIFGGYNSSRRTYLAASNAFKNENHGIHLGGMAESQNVLEINLPLHQKVKQLAENIGYSVEDKRVVTVYIPKK